jgi:tetratricopeptide (TPR) repeat protein
VTTIDWRDLALQTESFDVFVSYARVDGRHAADVDSLLRARGLTSFFDRRNLQPGLPWVRGLEKALNAAKAAVILIGSHGLGNTQQYERDLAIIRQTRAPSFPIVPVILPGAQVDRPFNFLQILTWIDFSHVTTVADAPAELERLLTAVRGGQISSADAAREAICPYRGLDAFREEDSAFFFGRGSADNSESPIGQLVRKVRDYPFVMVVGRSGSGKSSLVYAGLVPALRRARDRFWNVMTLRPGPEPLRALAAAFNPKAEGMGAAESAANIGREAEQLRSGDPELLSHMIREALERSEGKPDQLLLYIDQWEELYAQAPSASADKDRAARHAADVNRFIDLLLNASQSVRVSVVATVRADFYDPLISHQKLRALLPRQQVLLGAMSRAELESTIVEPAKRVGLTFVPPQLVSRILDEAGEDEGMLPLLQYALEETWELREGNVMTGDSYARSGGVREAIRLTAEQTFKELSPEDQQVARKLFLRLVTPGEGQEDTRARAAMPDEPMLLKIVDQFAGSRARLLVTGSDRAGRPTVEVAHEALIRTWPRLRHWVDANRDKLRARAAIVQAKAVWEEHGRREDLPLPPGFQLERARVLGADPGDITIDDIKAFIAESEAADARRRADYAARERQRQAAELAAAEEAAKSAEALASAARRTTRRTLIGLVASFALLALAGFLGWQVIEQQKAEELQREAAEAQRARTEIERAIGSESLGETSRALLELGNTAQALQAAKEVLRFSEVLAAKNPTNEAQRHNVATGYLRYGDILRAAGEHSDAMDAYGSAFRIQETVLGPSHPDIAQTLNRKASLLTFLGRYAEAEPLQKQALNIRETAIGADHPYVARSLEDLADLYLLLARYAESEALQKRALVIREGALGPDDPEVGRSLLALGRLYQIQGQTFDVKALTKRALSIFERTWGPDNPFVATALNNIAEGFVTQSNFSEAEPLFNRSLAIREKALGSDNLTVADVLNNIAGLYQSQNRLVEAELLYKRSLVIDVKAVGPEHPSVGGALSNLGQLYAKQVRYSEAEPLFKRSLEIDEKALGGNHPAVADVLNKLAGLYQSQNRLAEAEPLYRRSLEIGEKALGPDHPFVEKILGSFATLYVEKRDWQHATELLQRSAAAIVERAQRDAKDLGQARAASMNEESLQSNLFRQLAKAQDRFDHFGLLRAAFESAQWATMSNVAGSIAQAAARFSTSDLRLRQLVRARQDLVATWQKLDELRVAALARPPEQRNRQSEAESAAQLTRAETAIATIDKSLALDFPNYMSIVGPHPLSVEEVQQNLGVDEALMAFLDTSELGPAPEETFIWVVTKTGVRWVRSELGTPALTRETLALRCGLDSSIWFRHPQSNQNCLSLLRLQSAPVPGEPLPFDLQRSHALYTALFGQVEDLIKDKKLIIVPSGPLTSLPFSVLVTQPPDAKLSGFETYRNAAWLGMRQPITVLPSVVSLQALRKTAKQSDAPNPFIGFGNPLLLGALGGDRRAFRAQHCLANEEAPSNAAQVEVSDVSDSPNEINSNSRRGLLMSS